MEKGYFEWKFTLNYTHEKFRHVVPAKFDICGFFFINIIVGLNIHILHPFLHVSQILLRKSRLQ